MARICIITPGQLGSNPRTVKEAAALVEAGHDVQVIATRVMDEVEPRDRAILAKATWKTDRVDFQDRRKRALDRLFQSAAGALYRHAGVSAALGTAHNTMTRRLTRAALSHPADLYIAHYVAALPAAAAAARRHGAAYAFDAEDFHPGDLPDEPRYAARRAEIEAIEARYLPGASHVTAAAPGIARAYAERYGIAMPDVVLNVFPLADAPEHATIDGIAEPSPSLYWFSQTIGPGRGLECALRAIAKAKSKPALHLRGMLSEAYRTELGDLARLLGVEDRLIFLPLANPDEMVRLSADFDAGLVAETGHTHNRAIALTNKQFTYLLAGIPAIMSDIPAHREFAETAEGAVSLYRTEDADSLAGVMDELLSDPARLSAARRRAFDLGRERFNWERERLGLLAIVERSLASGTGEECRDD